MSDQTTPAGEVALAFLDHGITAVLTALIGGTIAYPRRRPHHHRHHQR